MMVAADEAGAAKVLFVEAEPLDLRAHRPVEDEHALIGRGPQRRQNLGAIGQSWGQIRAGSGSLLRKSGMSLC